MLTPSGGGGGGDSMCLAVIQEQNEVVITELCVKLVNLQEACIRVFDCKTGQ